VAVVEFLALTLACSVDFDGAAGEAEDVANIFQSGREDHDRKGAGQLILAEVEEVDSFFSNSYF